MSDRSKPVEIFAIEAEDSMRVLLQHNQDKTQVFLMVKFSSPPEFGDLLVGLSSMVDAMLEAGENHFPDGETSIGARH